MPNEGEHVQLALHNMEVAAHLLETPRFCDWVATATFYSALHVVEAVLSSKQNTDTRKHCHAHGSREDILKNAHRFTKMWTHYRELASFARIARYLEDSRGNARLFDTYLPPDQVRQVVILRHFGGLIRASSKFVSKTAAKKLETGFRSNFTKTRS